MLELRFVDAENRDFHDLTAKLDEYYFMLVGEVEKRYAKYNLPHLFDCRIVAYEDGKPAGCGAWKKIDEGTFEVKRIYIAPEFRRKGVASAVIAALDSGKIARFATDFVSERLIDRTDVSITPHRPHDRGFGGAVHQARLSRHSVLRQSGGRGKLPVL